MYQTSMGLNMVAAAATVGFVLYYCMKGVFPQESIVSCSVFILYPVNAISDTGGTRTPVG